MHCCCSHLRQSLHKCKRKLRLIPVRLESRTRAAACLFYVMIVIGNHALSSRMFRAAPEQTLHAPREKRTICSLLCLTKALSSSWLQLSEDAIKPRCGTTSVALLMAWRSPLVYFELSNLIPHIWMEILESRIAFIMTIRLKWVGYEQVRLMDHHQVQCSD